MSLTPGTPLGPYEILSALGTGGMGEVYRATDTNLKRQVAIKVLPASVPGDVDRLARFQREAEMLAALNHPNIAQIYGLESFDGTIALVMELVEGPTLADRIAQGPVPLDEALPIAKQIAEALEAAHEQGIIHRDLKPANIKVRPDGTVKVLDFGLAKALDRVSSSSVNVTQSPTITSPAMMTGVGVILGTAAYMSPEQAKGLPADKRSDIWAFGCVLYEILAGTRAFAGATLSDTLAEIIKGEPHWTALPSQTPLTITRLLRRCLAKDRKGRFADIADVRFDLDDSVNPSIERHGATATPGSMRSPLRAWHAVAALLLGVASGVLGLELTRRSPMPEPQAGSLRVSIVPPANVVVGGSASGGISPARILALSPDGRQLAFTAAGADGRLQLWIRGLDGSTAQPLVGTEGAQFPFWSPDSISVAFYVPEQRVLRKVDASGRAPVTICENVPALTGGTWNQNDVIVFGQYGSESPLMRVSAHGGEPEPATVLDAAVGETRQFAPFFLPDGDHFLFLSIGGRSRDAVSANGLYVGSLSSPARTLLRPVGSNAQYTQGLLLFLEGQRLMAQRFDVHDLTLRGTSTVVADGIRTGGPAGVRGAFTVSTNGLLAYIGGADTSADLVWLDRHGNQLGVVGGAANYDQLELAPDGRRAAVRMPDAATGNVDVWLFDTAAPGVRTRFTFNPGSDGHPVWSPDGTRVAWSSEREGFRSVFAKAASGDGTDELLMSMPGAFDPTSWAPDGRTLLVSGGTPSDLWRVSILGDHQPTSWLKTSFDKDSAQFSPDGRWVAYRSRESGRGEILAASFSNPSVKWQVSTEGGDFPRWGRDGRELFFLAPDGYLMAAAVVNGPSAPEFGPPQRLFLARARIAVGSARYTYDVAPDGQRFLVIREVDEVAAPINLLTNDASAAKMMTGPPCRL